MSLGMEDEYTEHKRTTSELREAMESVAAILNKHGHGTLYFGVRPSDGEVVGQDVSEKTLRDISQAFTNHIEPRVYPIIEHLVTEDGKSYVKVVFSGTERPYSCDGRYRIRSADEDLPMNQSALRLLMQDEYFRQHPWDREPSERPLSVVDENELRKFIERGQAKQRINFEHQSVEGSLSSLNLLRDGKLTNAADVLFCSSIPVQLKMGVFKTHARTEALDIRLETGTVFHLVDVAEYYIANNIRRRFVITGKRTRDEIPEIPFEAIREALMNAYAHRIWYRQGYVQVDIYHDAVDIISPGWFIDGQVPEDHLEGTSTDSSTRNELIATTLFRSGDIESSGMGIKKIRDLCDEAGVKITYEEIPFGTKLTFHRNDPFVTSTPNHAESLPNLAELLPNLAESQVLNTLTENEQEAVRLLAILGAVSTNDVAESTGIPVRTARYIMQKLVKKGIAEAHGSTKSRVYSLKGARTAE